MLQAHCIELDKHSCYNKQVLLCFIKQMLMQLCMILSTSMMWHNKKPFADIGDSDLSGLQKVLSTKEI